MTDTHNKIPGVYPYPCNFWKNLLYGGVAGSVGSLCTFPIDTAKTRVQNAIKSGAASQYTGIFDCLKKIATKEGFRALYRGLPVQMIGIIPEKALKLSVNDSARYFLRDSATGRITLQNEALAGGTAGFCQVIITAPMEQTKILMQLQFLKPEAERLPIPQVIKKVFGGGLQSIYKGAGATLCRDVFFSILYFPGFSRCKQFIALQPSDSAWKIMHVPGSSPEETNLAKRVSLLGTFVAGLVAGGFSAFLSTPMDVVKTRLQAEGGTEKWVNIRTCVRKTMAQEGPSAFFKGALGRVILIGPLFGIVLFTYEFLPQYLPL